MMNTNLENALYRNRPRYVNMNLFERRYSLTKPELEELLGQMRLYRNDPTHYMQSSQALRNLLSNLENNYVEKSRRGAGSVRWQNLVLGKSRLRTVRKPVYRRAPFTAANLQSAKAKLRSVPKRRSPPSLANLALAQMIKTGRGANVPMNALPMGSIRRAVPKSKISETNLAFGKKRLELVKNFKAYMAAVRNAKRFAETKETVNRNLRNYVEGVFQAVLNSYRVKYGLKPDEAQLLYSSVLKIMNSNRNYPRQQFLTGIRNKYRKYGFLSQKDVESLIRSMRVTMRKRKR